MNSDSSSGTSHSLSERVINTVADHEEVDPIELDERLYSVIESDALDSLFRGTKGTLQFSYCGYTVTVKHDETVLVEESDS